MALKYLDYEGAKTFKNKIDEVIINEISEVNGNIDSVNNEVSALKGKLGSADGIATLGSDGKVLSAQLPSTTAGSTIIPVYFDNGVPKACDHKLEADVPADAKFTDTIYTLPVAGTALGGVKTDYSENGKNYALKVDGDGSAYVTVPWVDVNLSTLGISVTASEINHLDGVTSNIQSQINGKLSTSLKGANNGLAELDNTGKVPSSQLPSFVDDVIEGTLGTFGTGEAGKIYVDTDTNITYRWSGSRFVEISSSIALGETSSTAYRGDRGKTAYEHSLLTSGNPHNVTYAEVGAPSTSGVNASGTWGISISGKAATADKLNANAGSTTQPVYFSNGVPTVIGYTIQSNVPANAKFTDTTYSNATTSTAGLMSAADKSKLDGLSNFTLQTAGASTLGGIKVGYSGSTAKRYGVKIDTSGNAYVDVPWTDTKYSLSSFGITATAAELNYVDGVTSNIQTQLNNKQASISGAASTITGSDLTANRALISNDSGKVAVSAVTSTELGYLDGVTSAIQTQLNGKAASSHTHNYFGSVTKTYVNKKFTEATSSVTISEWVSAISGAKGKEIEVYYNGLLLLPTEEYTFNEGTGVITFVNTLGGVGVEQTLTAVIRVYK